MGGRSRVAAQMLQSKGYDRILNLSGGIKAWNSQTAYGPEDQGLELFSGRESAEDVLVVACGAGVTAGMQSLSVNRADEVLLVLGADTDYLGHVLRQLGILDDV